jgi:hypothetical protein
VDFFESNQVGLPSAFFEKNAEERRECFFGRCAALVAIVCAFAFAGVEARSKHDLNFGGE